VFKGGIIVKGENRTWGTLVANCFVQNNSEKGCERAKLNRIVGSSGLKKKEIRRDRGFPRVRRRNVNNA